MYNNFNNLENNQQTIHHKTPTPIRILSIIFSILLFISIPAGFLVSEYSKACNTLKVEVEYYYEKCQKVITQAETEPQKYLIEGTIIGFKKSDDFYTWSIIYTIPNSLGTPLSQSTFFIYSNEQIQEYCINDKIIIAVDTETITEETLAVNVDFKNFEIHECPELNHILNIYKTVNVIKIGCYIITGLSLIVLIFAHPIYNYFSKKHQN